MQHNMPDVPDGLLTHICRIKGLYTPDACICVDHFNAKYLFWSVDWHFHTECWYNEASVLYYHLPCTQGSRASCSPPRGHPVQRSHHLSQGYVENPNSLEQFQNCQLAWCEYQAIRLSLRHNLKPKFSKWRPEHSEQCELCLLNPFLSLSIVKIHPSATKLWETIFSEKTVFGKIVLQLFCCTCRCLQACSIFLFVPELNSHTSSLPLPKGFDWSRKARLGRVVSHDCNSGSTCENLLLSSSPVLAWLGLDQRTAKKTGLFSLIPPERWISDRQDYMVGKPPLFKDLRVLCYISGVFHTRQS